MKNIFIVVIYLGIHFSAQSQYYFYNDKYFDNDFVFEVGAGIGAINAITDIGGQPKGSTKKYFNEINWQNTSLSNSIYFSGIYKSIIGGRLELTYGNIKGYDSLLAKGSSRYRRNLSYQSEIREISLMAEFHPLMLKDFESSPYFSPYIIGGVGWFAFNPQGNLNGNWIDLQPLSTEGQGFKEYPNRKPYKLKQANILLGAGLKFEASELFSFRLEWIHRYLFTDYLDDASTQYINPIVFATNLSPANAQNALLLFNRTGKPEREGAQRGDPKNTDSYFTVNFKLGFTLGRTRR